MILLNSTEDEQNHLTRSSMLHDTDCGEEIHSREDKVWFQIQTP